MTHCLDGAVDIGVTGNNNERYGIVLLAYRLQQFGAAHPGHAQIADDQLDRVRLKILQCRLRLLEHLAFKIGILGETGHQLTGLGIIINKQYDGLIIHARSCSVLTNGPVKAK